MVSSACRRAELAGLDLKDLDLTNRCATVVGKGRKVRQVHFSETSAILLTEYLKNHPGHDALFLNRRGGRVNQDSIYKIVAGLGKMAELSRPISPHCCRHTFATNLLGRGAGLDFIASELGHANLHSVRTYARLLPPHLMALYRKYMG